MPLADPSPTTAASTTHRRLRRQALRLVAVGEAWNVLEAAVALWAAVSTGSVALLAYGLDSLIELFAGAVLIWRLKREGGEEEERAAEKRALKLVGVTFFLLAAVVTAQSLSTLSGLLPKPQESLIGIALVIASAVLMTVLYVTKVRIAEKIGSRALRAEAKQSLTCDLQDLTVLLGLGLNALFAWWWADPIAALLLVPFLVREGWEGAFS
jgi:divalent metal cation (Fe/Co/Zn/Cd) transporter